MDTFSTGSLQNVCRSCLKELKQRQKFKISALNIQIRLWLKDALLTFHLPLKGYPNSICLACRNKLQKFLEFYEMCKKSREIIESILPNYEGKKFENENNFKFEPDLNIEMKEPFFANNLKVLESKNDTNHCMEDEPQVDEKFLLSNNCNYLYSESDVKILNQSLNSQSNPLLESENPNHVYSSDDNLVESGDTQTYSGRYQKNEYETNTRHRSKLPKPKRQKYPYTFRCKQCECLCMSQQTLDIHMRIHNGLKPYQCPKCKESFGKSTFLLKHLDITHNETKLNIICEYKDCGNQFTSIRSYKNHYREFHIPRTSNKHVCEECGKTYAKMQIFKEHQYTHGPKELYPFPCDQCDKTFVRQSAFDEHKLRHAGIKNFECPNCGIKKTTKKELKKHMNYHSKERPYPCSHCSMVFYTSTNRRMHVDVVHQGIRRFNCRYCDKRFGKGDNLKKHELLHTGEKPHACTKCAKRFVQKISLQTHMKTHNKL